MNLIDDVSHFEQRRRSFKDSLRSLSSNDDEVAEIESKHLGLSIYTEEKNNRRELTDWL